MVDRLDDGTIPAELGPLDYKGLYKVMWCKKICKFIKFDEGVFFFTIGTTFRLLEKLFSGLMLKAVLRSTHSSCCLGRYKISLLFFINISHKMTYENYAERDHV